MIVLGVELVLPLMLGLNLFSASLTFRPGAHSLSQGLYHLYKTWPVEFCQVEQGFDFFSLCIYLSLPEVYLGGDQKSLP